MLLKSKAGQMFAAGMDVSVFKRTFERILLSQKNVDKPLNVGDGRQILEVTELDPSTTFKLKADVVLSRIETDRLVFDVSSKGEILATGGPMVSTSTPKGTGQIIRTN